MAELTLQWVFQQGYAASALGPRLAAYVQQAVWALLACRTAVWGATLCQERGAAHPECCPLCGRQLVRCSVVPHSKIPPR